MARPVVFLVSNFEPAVGGTVTQIRNQARALRRSGTEVVVLTKPHRRGLPRDEELDGVRVVRRGPAPTGTDTTWSRGDKLKTLGVWTAWLWRRRHQIAAVQAVLHADLLIPPLLAGIGRRTGMLWVGRGDAERMLAGGSGAIGKVTALVRRRLLRAPFHVVLTSAMADDLSRLGIARSTVIPTPVDTDLFRPPNEEEREAARRALGLESRAITLLFVGHVVPEKGVHHLVRATAVLRDLGHRCRVLVVGEDRSSGRSYSPALRKLADEVGVADAVSLEGRVRDLRKHFWAADVVVLPSEREGMPNVLLEAMASGTPCVAPPSAGGDELLRQGGGIVPDGNDPESLARAIDRVLESGGRTGAMGLTARSTAVRQSPDAVVERYAGLYDSLRD
jgi:glycosyltransferase involved in cell wall biosynthesis